MTARIGLGLAALGRPGYINLGHDEDLPPGRQVDDLRRRTHELLDLVRSVLSVTDLRIEDHESGLAIAERYGLSVYDALIAATALASGCDRLYSEDMHHGLVIDGRLRIENPFLA